MTTTKVKRVRPLLRILLLTGLTGIGSFAFKPEIHKAITAKALSRASIRFSQVPVTEIENANVCTDNGPAIRSPEDEQDKPCLPNSFSLEQLLLAPGDHFDNEQFISGSALIRRLRERTIDMAKAGRFIEARKALGAALHTVQDFYSHSNWVELGQPGIFSNIEEIWKLWKDRSVRSLRLALEHEDVCASRIQYRYDRAGNQLQEILVSPGILLPEADADGFLLTSGYFFADAQRKTGAAKCHHGWVLDGIAKDSDESSHGKTYFERAKDLAVEHSVALVNDVLNSLDEKAAAGLASKLRVPADAVFETNVRVDAGEVYEFVTQRDGEIVWGHEGFLSALTGDGKPLTAGPVGVNASGLARTMIVPPPIPERGVGALIGFVRPLAGCEIGFRRDDGTGGKPCPAQYFYIGVGGRVEMPIGGTLCLQVNDGYLDNNSGEFEVEFTMVKRKSAR